MSLALNGTNGITYNDGSLQPSAPVGNNLIINGNMAIDQRNAGASVTPSNSYTLDRWTFATSVASKFTAQQSTTAPSDFNYSLLITSSSAYSVGSSDILALQQKIEGFNIAHLNWGTASAKTVTLSFWVRSSLTGTFGGSISNSGYTRSYPFSYTISSANTWEKITITIDGDTTGSWASDNSTGMRVIFGIGVGSTYSGTAGAWTGSELYSTTGATSVVGISGATLYITGVQLEANTTATPFEYLQYGQQLALCQRYAYMIPNSDTTGVGDGALVSSDGYMNTGGTFIGIYTMPVTMRNTPTISVTGTSNLEVAYADSSVTTVNGTSVGIISHISNRHQIIYTVTGSGHFSQPAFLRYADSTMSPVFLIQAEL